MNLLGRIFRLLVFLGGMSALNSIAQPSEPIDNIRMKIENAQDQGAIFKAPASLRRAETELQRAEDALEAKPRRPLALEHAIELAEYRAEELSLVLSELKAASYRIDEETALRRVRQRHQLSTPELARQEYAGLEKQRQEE